MKTLLLRLVLATMCMVAAASANAQTGDWGNFVFVSSTLGNNANKLCLGEGLRGSDVGCPTYAPTVLPGGYVGIGNNTPTVALSVNGEVQVSNSSVACSGSTKGSIRYSTTSNTLEYCNSTAWVSAGPSGTAVPYFRVSKPSVQSIPATTWTKLTWPTEELDSNNNFDSATNHRFTVTVPGRYLLSAALECSAQCNIAFYKNGTALKMSFVGANGNPNIVTLQDLNISDFIEVYAYSTGASSIASSSPNYSTFQGTLLGSGSGSGSGSGVSAMASLTDVQLTNLAGRDYLRYDQPSGKWVNISESSAMSTTTMVPNWPDAIKCASTMRGETVLALSLGPYTDGNYYYIEPQSTGSGLFVYYNAAGTFVGQLGMGTLSGGCQTSIAATYAAGRAFNFIGGASSNALGDRITSGTSAVTVNSATSIISLTTGGVDWGYLNSGLSYLPRLNAANVSATFVSSTITQVSGTSLACTTALKGSIRYSNTSNTLEYCNSTAWVSAGPSDTLIPAFSVNKNGTNQTVTTGTYTLLTFSTETYDTNNNFASDRFTPTIPGKYLITGQVGCMNAGSAGCASAIYKNGSQIFVGSYVGGTAGDNYSNVSAVIDMNGTTDYLELYGWNNGTTIYGNIQRTYFQGTLITMGGVGSGGGGSGVSAMASLTDVTLTNLAGRDHLRYDNATSKWVNISESTVMSTTTMAAGWPDAIQCYGASGSVNLYHGSVVGGSHYYVSGYTSTLVTQNMYVIFNGSGVWTSSNNAGAWTGYYETNCNSGANTTATLYATGRAFNFIGTANTSASTALGDRITSGTSAITVNSETSYISLTTGGVDWGYLNSGLSYLPRLNAANVSASYVSSTLTQVSGTSLACTTALKGSIRYSNTSNTLEYCNSTAWVSAGPSASTAVAFSVGKGSTAQTVAANTPTKLTWSVEDFDTNNNFASDRFTPTIPGKYLITLTTYCTATSGYCQSEIRKNGTLVNGGYDFNTASGGATPEVISIVDMNGSTDYIEGYVVNSTGTSISGDARFTFMQGVLLGPQAGGAGGGGTATPAGISGSIQFNSAGALAGRSDIIVDPSGSVGIGTGAPKAALDVSGTVKMAGTGAEACVSNTLGTFRFNPINGVPQICR